MRRRQGRAEEETEAQSRRREADVRLTKLEKEMLERSGEFVKAGEWPWDERAVERRALDSALSKLYGSPATNALTLTPEQHEFLSIVMQDYIDVTTDAGIRRRAKQIRAKLERLRGVDSTTKA